MGNRIELFNTDMKESTLLALPVPDVYTYVNNACLCGNMSLIVSYN